MLDSCVLPQRRLLYILDTCKEMVVMSDDKETVENNLLHVHVQHRGGSL
jgi:hypothetical protein